MVKKNHKYSRNIVIKKINEVKAGYKRPVNV